MAAVVADADAAMALDPMDEPSRTGRRHGERAGGARAGGASRGHIELPPTDDDITAEFWGDAPAWRTSGSTPRVTRSRRPDRSGRLRRVTSGGRVDRTRSHRPVDPWASEPTVLFDQAAEDRRPPSAPASGGSIPGDPLSGSVPVLTSDAARREPAPPSWRDLDHVALTPSGRVELELDVDLDRRVDLDDLTAPPAPGNRWRVDRDRGSARRHGDPSERPSLRPSHQPSHSGPAPSAAAPVRALADRLGIGSVDPLLLRLGAIVAVGVLMVPVALLVRANPDEELRVGSSLAATAARATAARAAPAATSPLPADASVASDDPAVSATAAPVPCTLTYTVGAGDYWLRIAEESGTPLGDVLAANGATTDTAIHPGDEVCLPPGAVLPSPPTTAPSPPVTTAPPTTTATAAASSTASSTASSSATSSGTTSSGTRTASGAAPTTTAPSTAAPPPQAPPTTAAQPAPRATASSESPEQVRSIIREIWPADLADRAVTIAERESGLRPGAYNGHCCYGVFQLHWTSHRRWMANHGVTSSAQLLDARTNVTLAYELYRRSGGWGPWSQTAYG